jgi:sugar lactone lactonase YvrE
MLLFSAAEADDYGDARAELVAAYQQQEYPTMLLAARRAVVARPGYPGALFNLALAQTLNSDHGGSLQTLNILADMGVDFGATELDEFAALRELGTWGAYEAKIETLLAPSGGVEVVATYPDSNFVPEGIAIDSEGQLFIGGIRTGELVRLASTPEILQQKGDGWSVFGMRFHSDGSLWFASAAVPQLDGVGEDEGQTGLFRMDISSGEITRSAVLPQYAESQVLGDLVIADDNTLYATDSLTGAIYRYHIDANEFETLVKRGRLGSPQGLALDAGGNFLYVADYIGGLYRVSVQDGSMAKVGVPVGMSDYGIDGLYRYGDELIAIQNGSRPNKVVALQLGDNGMSLASIRLLAANLKEFDEPTLGVVHGDDFFFAANSHWNRFDRENKLPEGLSGPIILKLPLN